DELEEDGVDLCVIISDWLMPGLKGDDFLIKVHKKLPRVIKILLTGQADEAAVVRATEEANLEQCLHKPWQGEELIETINMALAKIEYP
ncbi:MAG: response regulator, partial [Chloroflexota bacterium]